MTDQQKDILKLLGIEHIKDTKYHIPYLGECELNTIKDLQDIIELVYNQGYNAGTENGKDLMKRKLKNLFN